MKAISIRQPWAWLILNAGKDIENRSWQTNVRGRVLIHAAQGMTRAEYTEASDFVEKSTGFRIAPFSDVCLPPPNKLERGGIVGVVTITDCISRSASPWFFGRFGFVLSNPVTLPFVQMRGALGFFDVPDFVTTEKT